MSKINRFWNWARDTNTDERVLYLEGVIAEQGWFDDDITPAVFKDELFSGAGPITIWLSSPGGDVVAASRIYSLLMDYPWDVTIKISGVAASAASVIAMSGTRVLMAPTSLMMLHNPFTAVIGDTDEMRKAIDMLSEVKDAILTAYELRTGLSRARLSHMLDAETWLSANKAVALHFADGILFEDHHRQLDDAADEPSYLFSRRAVTNCLLDSIRMKLPKSHEPQPEKPAGVPIESLSKRLDLLAH
jgi:ATP-dependent Clp protease protease subunit